MLNRILVLYTVSKDVCSVTRTFRRHSLASSWKYEYFACENEGETSSLNYAVYILGIFNRASGISSADEYSQSQSFGNEINTEQFEQTYSLPLPEDSGDEFALDTEDFQVPFVAVHTNFTTDGPDASGVTRQSTTPPPASDAIVLKWLVDALGTYSRAVNERVFFVKPGADMAHTFVTYIILIIAAERCVAFSRPFFRRRLLNVTRVKIYLGALAALVILLHVPAYLEPNPASWTIDVQMLNGTFQFDKREMRRDTQRYFVAYRIGQVTLCKLLPILLITTLGLRLVCVLKKAQLFGKRQRSISTGGSSPALMTRGTLVAVASVACFLIGELPDFMTGIVSLIDYADRAFDGIIRRRLLHPESRLDLSQLSAQMHQFSTRILDLAACFNLVIYLVCGSRFRNTLRQMVLGTCGCGGGGRPGNASVRGVPLALNLNGSTSLRPGGSSVSTSFAHRERVSSSSPSTLRQSCSVQNGCQNVRRSPCCTFSVLSPLSPDTPLSFGPPLYNPSDGSIRTTHIALSPVTPLSINEHCF